MYHKFKYNNKKKNSKELKEKELINIEDYKKKEIRLNNIKNLRIGYNPDHLLEIKVYKINN